MKWLGRERLKLYILFLLILTSFIQVGILWYYQNRGVPTNFLWGFFYKAQRETEYDMGMLSSLIGLWFLKDLKVPIG